MIAALYVDPLRGPYGSMKGVDAWGVERDGRLYDGPHSVVAHPPCAQWGRLSWRALPDADAKACGPRAIEQARLYGGVVEHPADSTLWRHCKLIPPGFMQDRWGGWTMEIDQTRWGHPCAKRTWLYIVGVKRSDLPPIPPPREPTHVIVASNAANGYGRHLPKSQRHLTPPAFAEWLVQVATTALSSRLPLRPTASASEG